MCTAPEQCLAEALKAAESGRLESALEQLHELINAPRVDDATLARAYELQGRCELGLLRNIQAMMSFREAEQTYGECGMDAECAYCRLMQVRKLLDDRLLKEAGRRLDETMQTAQTRDWPDVYRLGLEFRGLLKLHAREFRRAVDLMEEALDNPDGRKLGWEPLLIKLSLTNCWFSLENRDRALELLSHIAEDPRFDNIPRLAIYTLMNLGYHAYLMREHRTARGYFNGVLKQVRDSERQPRALGWLGVMARYNLGQLAIDEGEYEEAVGILLEVVKATAEHGYQQLLVGGLLALSVAELLTGQPDRALLHAQLSQQHTVEFGDIETQLAGYVLALAHLAGNQTEAAKRFWREKSTLEDHRETGLHYSWMHKILEHLQDKGAGDPFNLDAPTRELAGEWLAEIETTIAGAGTDGVSPS